MEDKNKNEKVSLTAIAPADGAKVLSAAFGRKISEQQVTLVAQRGDLLSDDGTVNLLEYAAFLIKELADGRSDQSP